MILCRVSVAEYGERDDGRQNTESTPNQLSDWPNDQLTNQTGQVSYCHLVPEAQSLPSPPLPLAVQCYSYIYTIQSNSTSKTNLKPYPLPPLLPPGWTCTKTSDPQNRRQACLIASGYTVINRWSRTGEIRIRLWNRANDQDSMDRN